MNNPIIALLKSINGMPFPFTMRHYQVFGEVTEQMKDNALISPEAWDALRENHPFFSIPSTREEWVAVSELAVKKDGQDAKLIERAQDIANLILTKGYTKLFSVGSGGAALEYQLKKLIPSLSIVCSDYSSVTVTRLKKVFTESTDVIQFDILEGDWKSIQETYLGEDGLCLMYRLDAGFDDDTWKHIFKKTADANVMSLLVIPTGTLSILSIYNRKRREMGWAFKRIPVVFSGFIRTKSRFYQHWNKEYQAQEGRYGGLLGFLLTKRVKE